MIQQLTRPSVLVTAALLLFAGSCRSSENETARGQIVISAPAPGEVRRVLVNEGAAVVEGAVVLEIAVRTDVPDQQSQSEDSWAQARAAVEASQKAIEAAEAEVQRTRVDMQRVEQLVGSGLASRAELDAARARYQQAQEQLEDLRRTAQSARDYLAFRQGRAGDLAGSREEIITVRAPASGRVAAISARTGQQVTRDQPLATLIGDTQ